MFPLGTAGLILKWIVSPPFNPLLGDYFRLAGCLTLRLLVRVSWGAPVAAVEPRAVLDPGQKVACASYSPPLTDGLVASYFVMICCLRDGLAAEYPLVRLVG